LSTGKVTKLNENARIIDRIEDFRAASGLEMPDFCRKIGVRYNTYFTSVQRKSKSGEDLLTALVNNTGVNPVWLLTGEGDMLRPAQPKTPPEPATPTDVSGHTHQDVDSWSADLARENVLLYRATSANLQGQVDALTRQNEKLQEDLRRERERNDRLNERLWALADKKGGAAPGDPLVNDSPPGKTTR